MEYCEVETNFGAENTMWSLSCGENLKSSAA
jgi:hypothetical protein